MTIERPRIFTDIDGRIRVAFDGMELDAHDVTRKAIDATVYGAIDLAALRWLRGGVRLLEAQAWFTLAVAHEAGEVLGHHLDAKADARLRTDPPCTTS